MAAGAAAAAAAPSSYSSTPPQMQAVYQQQATAMAVYPVTSAAVTHSSVQSLSVPILPVQLPATNAVVSSVAGIAVLPSNVVASFVQQQTAAGKLPYSHIISIG